MARDLTLMLHAPLSAACHHEAVSAGQAQSVSQLVQPEVLFTGIAHVLKVRDHS